MIQNSDLTIIYRYLFLCLVGGRPTPLKNDGVRQLGLLFRIYGKIQKKFQTTNQVFTWKGTSTNFGGLYVYMAMIFWWFLVSPYHKKSGSAAQVVCFFLNIGNIRKYLKQPIVYNSKLMYLLKKITWHGHWKRAFSSLIYYFPDATAILIHQRVTSSWDLHQIPTTCSSAQLLFTA